jgi:hypothetical protein
MEEDSNLSLDEWGNVHPIFSGVFQGFSDVILSDNHVTVDLKLRVTGRKTEDGKFVFNKIDFRNESDAFGLLSQDDKSKSTWEETVEVIRQVLLGKSEMRTKKYFNSSSF